MIWLFFIAMTIATLALVFLPFFKAQREQPLYNSDEITHRHELEVYKDQLKEVDRDLENGTLAGTEAEAAKLEISRKLLITAENLEKSEGTVALSEEVPSDSKDESQSDESQVVEGKVQSLKTKLHVKKDALVQKLPAIGQKAVKRWAGYHHIKQMGLGISAGVSFLALSLYGFYGSPFAKDQPYAQRFAKESNKIKPFKKEMADLEVYLKDNDEDGKAWQKMAAFYMNSTSYHKAIFAFRKAIGILGENPSRLTGFAEANVMANKGKVTDIAMNAYRRALKIDPDLVEPRVRIAMGLEQQGVKDQALKVYRDVLKRSAKDAPWLPFINKRVAIITGHKPAPRQPTAQEKNIDSLIAKVEVSLKANPKEGRGWNVIAPVYLSRGRYKDAKGAFEKAIALLGENAKRLSGLGEAITLLSDGQITKEAEAHFMKALKLEPKMIEPKIRLAMSLEQQNKLKQAAKAYQKIIDDGGTKTPWYPIIKERIDIVTARLKGGVPKPPAPTAPAMSKVEKGPSAEQVKDAAAMSVMDRQAMINQMVSNLAGRLEEDGKDLSGWLKLLNAYKVLGKKAEAGKALVKARIIFKDNKQAMTQLKSAAQGLGLQ